MSAVAAYIQLRDGDYFVGASRVTLRGIVEGWKRGEPPEYIQESYPSLSLAQVFGTLAFYLERQEEVAANFRVTDETLEYPGRVGDLTRAGRHRSMRA